MVCVGRRYAGGVPGPACIGRGPSPCPAAAARRHGRELPRGATRRGQTRAISSDARRRQAQDDRLGRWSIEIRAITLIRTDEPQTTGSAGPVPRAFCPAPDGRHTMAPLSPHGGPLCGVGLARSDGVCPAAAGQQTPPLHLRRPCSRRPAPPDSEQELCSPLASRNLFALSDMIG